MNGMLPRILGRTIAILAGAIWLGGLVFYAGAVIPTAHEVLGSHRTVGFITQRVTLKVNVMAVVTLVLFAAAICGGWRDAAQRLRYVLAGAWLALVALQGLLFALHPMLDRLLDVEQQEIIDEQRFYQLHRAYLISSMGQMLGGLVLLISLLVLWSRADAIGFDPQELP